MALPVALLVVAAAAILLHRAADAIRGSPVREVVFASDATGGPRPSLASPAFRDALAALADLDLAAGHTVEILVDDLVFRRLLPELRRARRSITLMGYSCAPGRLGHQLAQVLAERARDGVDVLFLGDGFGCRSLVRSERAALEAAGVEVAVFRPVHWYTLHRAQHRMHARSVVIDGVIGYTGGFGIDDKWAFGRPEEPLWRETNVRVTGPAVRRMQAAFLAAWAETTGDLRAGDPFLPAASPDDGPAEGGLLAGFLYSAPAIGTTPAERHLALTLAATERTLYIANSYFVPTPLMRRLLADAVGRGVDVRVLLPGRRTDLPSVRYVSRAYYEELIAAGVRIFEYQPAMMHAKTLVSDGAWVVIGSLNLDNRSARLNDEAALVAWDAALGAAMDSLFLADLDHSREITDEVHRGRPTLDRILERLAVWFGPLL